jgi:hypothetical protein
VFRVGVLQDTFGAKHLLVTFAEELNFFVFMETNFEFLKGLNAV